MDAKREFIPIWIRFPRTSFANCSKRPQTMANAPPVPHRTVDLPGVLRVGHQSVGKRVHIVTLVDRRPSAPSAPLEWLFQTELEDVLYPSVMSMGTAGAFYRLLKRSAAGNGMALSLRNTCITAGIVTEVEFTASRRY